MSDQTKEYEVDQDVPPEPRPQPQAPAVQPMGNFTEPPAEREVDPNEALTEAQAEERQREADEAAKPEEKDDVLDVLVSKAEPRTWNFGPEDMQLTFVQRRLSFVGKMQWFSLVGGVLDKAMAGPDGVSVNELLSAPGGGRNMGLADFRDADQFVRAIGKLLVYAPTFLVDSYCIWLNVPDTQRRLVGEIMQSPEEEGGLSDDDGLEMIEIFIDQNYDALADFFGGKIANVQRRISQRQKDRAARA